MCIDVFILSDYCREVWLSDSFQTVIEPGFVFLAPVVQQGQGVFIFYEEVENRAVVGDELLHGGIVIARNTAQRQPFAVIYKGNVFSVLSFQISERETECSVTAVFGTS